MADLTRKTVPGIALVTPGFPPDIGGVETVVGHLADGLYARGQTVTVFAQRPRNKNWPEDRPYPVLRFPDVTRTRQFPFAPGLLRALRAAGPNFDMMHAHSFHAAPALMTLTVPNLPLVFTPHFHAVGHTRIARAVHLAYDPLARRLFDRADVVTCVSHAEAELLAERYPRAGPKVVVIPNGVDVAGIQAARPYDVEGPVLLVAGRLEEYKRVALVLRAFARTSNALLVVCGTGPELNALQRLAGELGVRTRVDFRGFVSKGELRRWQRTAMATVTMSRHEAFGLVILEAAAAGSRIVASDIPAHRELATLVGGDERLTLVPPDVGVLAEALEEVAVSPRPLMITKGIPTWDSVADAFLGTYASLA